MKKTVILICLAMLIIISGCAADTSGAVSAAPGSVSAASNGASAARPEAPVTPAAFPSPVPNPEAAKSLIAKVQNDISMNTFGGVAKESTYGDCLKTIEPDKLSLAVLVSNTEVMGYPAVMSGEFMRYNNMLLSDMGFSIYPRGGESSEEIKTDLLANLDKELGSHEEDNGNIHWEKDGLRVSMMNNYYMGSGAWYISVSYIPVGSPPNTPGFFPYKLGTDVYTVYAGIKPGELPEDNEADNMLICYDKGVNTCMKFKTDETGALKLYDVYYSIQLIDMEMGDSLDFFESVTDGFKAALGAPLSKGYIIAKPSETQEGLMVEEGALGEGNGPQYVLESGSKQYRLLAEWKGITFEARYDENSASIEVRFLEI